MASADEPVVVRTMVHWYSPRQLVRTLADMLSSTVVVRILDPRALERETERLPALIDWRRRREVWLDFVADTGDGFNSTFSVARTLAQDELELVDGAHYRHLTRRGDALIFGGDLAYPTPRGESYEERLVGPYGEAVAK